MKAEYFAEYKKKMNELQIFLTDSVRFLASYDIKRSQQEIEKTNKSIKEAEDKFVPKTKFSFKSRGQDQK